MVFGLLFVGCGTPDECSDLLPSGAEPSLEIRTLAEASLAALDGPPPGEPEFREDLERFFGMRQDLYVHSARDSTGERFFSLWERQPGRPLWLEFELDNRRLLGAGTRARRILESPACTDTTTALGAFAHAWGVSRRSDQEFLRWLRLAQERRAELDPLSAMWIDLRVAYAERRIGRPERSLEILTDRIAPARDLGGWVLEAMVWRDIAFSLRAAGELDDALLAVTVADTLAAAGAGQEGPIVLRLDIRRSRASILALRRNFDLAFALYGANVAAAAERSLASVASANLNRAAILADEIGDRDRSLDFCRRGLALSVADRDSLSIPRHRVNISRRHRMAGDLDSCRIYLEDAARCVEACPIRSNVAWLPVMQAEYYAQIGEFATVDSLLDAAARFEENSNSVESRAELHIELIRGWMEIGRPDLIYRSLEAVEDLRDWRGDSAPDRNVAADLNLLAAEFLIQRGEIGRAVDALDRAEEAVSRRPSLKRSFSLARNRGSLARDRGDLAGAEKYFRECIELGRQLASPELEATGAFLLGSVLLAADRPTEARAVLPETDSEVFAGRQTTRISALVLAGKAYAAEGDHEAALRALEEARGACRSWSPPDLLARIDLETGRVLAETGRTREAQSRLESVAARLTTDDESATTEELAYFNGDLRRDLVEAILALAPVRPSEELRLARRVLPLWAAGESAAARLSPRPQTVFFVGEERSARWDVRDGSVRRVALPGRAELKNLLDPVLADLGTPGRHGSAADLQNLADTLLRGIEATWKTGEALVVVPDLFLFDTPWAALQLSAEHVPLLDRGPIAISDRPVTTPGLARRHAPDGRLLVVGADRDAAAQASGLSALHHAEREAEEVAAVWPANNATVRTGEEAAAGLSAALNLNTYEAIHIASHARVFDGAAGQSMLLLAGEENDAWTASRIAALDLDADLVFLSCCEAADGHERRSGNAGLARSFLDAGAHVVVAPTQRIDDEAARDLATRFYRHWLAGLPAPDALRAAQQEMRTNAGRWSHPFYWAFYQAVASEAP